MFVVRFEAEIGGVKFIRCHSARIEHKRNQLGKRAVLQLPLTARLERQGELVSEVETAKQFRVGDEVIIRMGYDNRVEEEFRGFVRRIQPTMPLEIECEDAAYLLRRRRLQKSFRNPTMRQLIEYAIEGTGIELANEPPEVNFSTFSFRNVNAAQALDQLRSTYGLTIYFTEYAKLAVGLASETDGRVVKYTIGQNVVSTDLEWEDEEDVLLNVKVIAVGKDNSFREETVGDPAGQQRTVFLYNIAAGVDLKARGAEELLRYRYSGYRGSLTGFLRPRAEVGNTVRLKDETFENREGDYIIEEVVTTLSTSGGRRKVTLGLKLD